MKIVNADVLSGAIKVWLVTQAELVDKFTCEAMLAAIDTSQMEVRRHTCPDCGHRWLEDCDATDYPNYCPGCGEPLREESRDENPD